MYRAWNIELPIFFRFRFFFQISNCAHVWNQSDKRLLIELKENFKPVKVLALSAVLIELLNQICRLNIILLLKLEGLLSLLTKAIMLKWQT